MLTGEFPLQKDNDKRAMGYIDRVSGKIAALLVREGLDYYQSKAVFKAARQKAGLTPPKRPRKTVDRLTLEEELRFIDHAYAQGGHTGLRWRGRPASVNGSIPICYGIRSRPNSWA